MSHVLEKGENMDKKEALDRLYNMTVTYIKSSFMADKVSVLSRDSLPEHPTAGNMNKLHKKLNDFTIREESIMKRVNDLMEVLTEPTQDKNDKLEAMDHAIELMRNEPGGHGYHIDLLREIRDEI